MRARLEKVGQGWRWAKLYLPGFLAVLVVAGAILALICVPKMQVSDLYWLSPKVRFDIENEARRTLAYIIGGILAVIGIILTFRRIRALERQVMVAQEGQITERFTRAIEQLGSQEMAIRLGGIYALERIANDSDKDYWPIMETLAAYVRELAPWRKPLPGSPEAATGSNASEEPGSEVEGFVIKPATDIQAVLTVLGRRKYRDGQEEGRLDLRNTDLRGADLRNTHLKGINLQGTNLGGAKLQEANLEGAMMKFAHLHRAILNGTALDGAELEEASLKGAFLKGAFLKGAYLRGAKLQSANLDGAKLGEAKLEGAEFNGAYLKGAILKGAYLRGAKLQNVNLDGASLGAANLEGAILTGANLKKAKLGITNLKEAILEKAHLEGALLQETNLKGADLSGATGLTREQLAIAITDETTILPDYLQEKQPKADGPEGNGEA